MFITYRIIVLMRGRYKGLYKYIKKLQQVSLSLDFGVHGLGIPRVAIAVANFSYSILLAIRSCISQGSPLIQSKQKMFV